jgi:hypothetical protein
MLVGSALLLASMTEAPRLLVLGSFFVVVAGAYLCASDDYLRINAKRHDLYKPSVAHSGQGAACRYDRDHLDIIALHMKNPEVFDEDTALLVWKRGEMNAIQDKLEKAKSRKAKP